MKHLLLLCLVLSSLLRAEDKYFTERRLVSGRVVSHKFSAQNLIVLPADGSRPYLVPHSGDKLSLLELRKKLEQSPLYKWVGLNSVVVAQGQTSAMTNDPLLQQQWALLPTEEGGIGWVPETAAIDQSHNYIFVLDTGACPEHEDMPALYWWYNAIIRLTGITDTHGHGCAVSSIISAKTNNAVGLAGVASSSNVLAVRVLDPGGQATVWETIEGIYASIDKTQEILSIDQKARFLFNLSFGIAEKNPALDYAVQTAVDYGILVVIAAGNDGLNLDKSEYTPRAKGAIVVCATDADGKLVQTSWRSNYGPKTVDICAPGDNILVAAMTTPLAPKGGQLVDNSRKSTYGTVNGTSFSAPHVVGALSLLLGKYPELTQTQAISLLRKSAKPMPGGEKYSVSGGSLDLKSLLSAK